MNKTVKIIKNILGEDIVEVLEKAEIGSGIFKPETNTALDPAEIKIALEIVPRAILGFLISNLKPLNIGGNLDLKLPFAEATLHVNKISNDVYTGDIISNGKRITEFKYRSLPGIGLILMSTFELYDVKNLSEIQNNSESNDKVNKLQEIIDERLRLNNLIRSVVDQRMSERDAIKQLINERLSEQLEDDDSEYEEEEDEEGDLEPIHPEEDTIEVLHNSEEEDMITSDKKSKLKQFLQNKDKKRQEQVELDKNENISCPNCSTDIYKGEKHFKLCICYGAFHNKEIAIKKNEDGKFNFKFPKSFDSDNVEMLLEAIKSSK